MRSDNNISLLVLADIKEPLCVSAFSRFNIKIIHHEDEIKHSLLLEPFDALIIAPASLPESTKATLCQVHSIWPGIPQFTLGVNSSLFVNTTILEPEPDPDTMQELISSLLFNLSGESLGGSYLSKAAELTQRMGHIIFNGEQWNKEKSLCTLTSRLFSDIYISFADVHSCSLVKISEHQMSSSLTSSIREFLRNRLTYLDVEMCTAGLTLSEDTNSPSHDDTEFDSQKLITLPIQQDSIISGVLVLYFTDSCSFTVYEKQHLLGYLNQTTFTLQNARNLSSKDSLTGLYNHSYLNRVLTRIWRQSLSDKKPMAIAMLDIDYFKNLNDSYGHQVGDLLIIELSKLVSSVTKKHDIIARCGGDELIILLPNTDSVGARNFAERLLEIVRNFEFTAAGCPLHFTISIGLASTDVLHVDNESQLLELSDRAMYLAKKSGRNQYCVASDIVTNTEEQTPEYSEYDSRTLAQYQNSQLGKGRILVVDDDVPIVTLLTRILEVSGYEVVSTTKATKALELIRSEPDLFDVILSDINMPVMDGIQLLTSIRDIDPNIVGVIITGYASTQNTINALRAGAYNLIQKPFNVDEINLIIERAVERRRLKRQLDAYHINLEEVLQDKTKALHSALNNLKGSYIKTMEAIIQVLDVHETTMANHSQRVSQLSVYLAKQMGITDMGVLNTVKYGALLHDIGKIGVPDTILTKPAKLNDEEWEIMKDHPAIGYNIVKTIPVLERAAEMVRSHHEKFDGSGYPFGLVGEDICIEARIFAVIDAYDALRNHRCYQDAQPLSMIIDEVNNCSGAHFDPAVVNAFNNCYQELDNLPLEDESFWENF